MIFAIGIRVSHFFVPRGCGTCALKHCPGFGQGVDGQASN